MDESTGLVDSSISLSAEKTAPIPKAIFVGDELNLDIWVAPDQSQTRSMMIRSIDSEGNIRSAFLHIENDQVRRIPTFPNSVELAPESAGTFEAIQPKRERRVKRERLAKEKVRKNSNTEAKKAFTWKFTFELISAAMVAALLAMMFFGALQLRTILTGSMIPTLKPGDIVVAVAPQWDTPAVGKIAIYHARDLQGNAVSSWAHRIVGGNAKDGFIFKGDANPMPDLGHPTLSDVESVVIFKIPFLGKYLNPITVGMCIVGIALILWAKRRW